MCILVVFIIRVVLVHVVSKAIIENSTARNKKKNWRKNVEDLHGHFGAFRGGGAKMSPFIFYLIGIKIQMGSSYCQSSLPLLQSGVKFKLGGNPNSTTVSHSVLNVVSMLS